MGMQEVRNSINVAQSRRGRTEAGGDTFVPGQDAHLTPEEVQQMSQSLGQEYQSFLDLAGIPDNVWARRKFTDKLNKEGRLPDNYHLGEGGNVSRDMSKTQAAFITAIVVGAPMVAAYAAPGAGATPIAGEGGGAAGGGAAATGASEAAALEGSAVEGITPELAGSLGADSAAGTGIGTSGGSILGRSAGYLKKAAPILGGMAKAGADANAARDRILPSMEGAQLARDKFALDAPGTRMSQSVRASAIKNAAPVKVNWAGPGSGARGEVPNFSGGYQDALANLDPETRQLAEATIHKDLQDQLAGKDDETKWLDQFGKTSTKDKIIGGLATGANIYAGVTR